MSKNFYKKTTNQGNLFYSTGASSEPNMRQEMENTLDGSFPEITKKQIVVLRKMRRDSAGNLTQCPCVDILTKEPDLDTFCPICHGEAYIWDEIFMDAYKVVIRSSVGLAAKEEIFKAGLVNIPIVSFYTRFSTPVTSDDKVVELIVDNDGDPVRPYKREFLYRIGTLIDFRLDGGKIEYWKLDCYAEQRKFLNGPKG